MAEQPDMAARRKKLLNEQKWLMAVMGSVRRLEAARNGDAEMINLDWQSPTTSVAGVAGQSLESRLAGSSVLRNDSFSSPAVTMARQPIYVPSARNRLA